MSWKFLRVTPFVVAAAVFAGAAMMGTATAGPGCGGDKAAGAGCSGKATMVEAKTCPVTGEAKAAMTAAEPSVQVVPAIATETRASCGSKATASMAKAGCEGKSACDGAKASMTSMAAAGGCGTQATAAMAKADCADKAGCTKATSVAYDKSNCDPAKCDDKSKASKYTQAIRTPEVILVKFHSDNCTNCTELEPRLTELEKTYKDKAALFVTFDLTSEQSKNQAELMASLLGLGQLWQENAGQTGLIHVVNAKTLESVAVLKNGQSAEDMSVVLAQALTTSQS